MTTLDAEATSRLNQVADRHRGKGPSSLVPLLQDIQRELRYLPEDAMRAAAEALDVPLSRVYAVATFYKAFHLTPRGRTTLKVCVGTTCHIRGAASILEEIRRELSIGPGETTKDTTYSLETVGCVGACAQSPVIMVENRYLTNVKPGSVVRRIEKADSPT